MSISTQKRSGSHGAWEDITAADVAHLSQRPAYKAHKVKVRTSSRDRFSTRVYELRPEMMSLFVLVRKGDRLRLQVSNQDSLIADTPMMHWYGGKVGSDTYKHGQVYPSYLNIRERPQ